MITLLKIPIDLLMKNRYKEKNRRKKGSWIDGQTEKDGKRKDDLK